MAIKMKIVALDGCTLSPDNPWTPVEQLGELTVYENTTSDQIFSRVSDANIIITNKVPLDHNLLGQLPDLKFISVTATGFNVIDVVHARQMGIPVSNVPVYSTMSVAQHVFATLLSFIHQPNEHHLAIQGGRWQQDGNFSFWLKPLYELAGKKFGVIGLGRIGQATARLAAAFGMKLVAASRTQKPVDNFPEFEWMSIEEVFSTADIVSLHCPQNESTKGMVDRVLLSKMKTNAILINTARGGLVDETDLAEALNLGQIAGALLDVVSEEPISEDNPLLTARNCLLTPHLAWTTIEARQRLMQTTADNIQAFLNGEPINVVNK